MHSVSVIIPHAGGREILHECLTALSASVGVTLEVILVDNGSDDAAEVASHYNDVKILRYDRRLGFAVACNRGVEAATHELVFLLNNDANVEPESIKILADSITNRDDVAGCQPKLLSLLAPGKFDYSSAAGGEIDVYGIPFARGRIFETLEDDNGQYDENTEIFWGAGAALMIRRSLYLQAGGLEEFYFAHMEEIDLLWRMHLMGYKVLAIPASIVYHRGATTIRSGSFTKLYLNQRNSLVTIFRNYSTLSIFRYMPGRLLQDVAGIVLSIFRLNFTHCAAILYAECWFWISLFYLIKSRRRVQQLRRVPDRVILSRMYPHSVAWAYYIKRRRTWRDLTANTPQGGSLTARKGINS